MWNRYVNISRVLPRFETQRLKLRENAHFVFGGDAVDWGVGDLRFVSELVELYEEYPGKVHIVLGNRDINKLRLLQELRPRHIETHPLKRLSQPYWTRKRKNTVRAMLCGHPDNADASTMDSTIHDGCTEGIRVSKRGIVVDERGAKSPIPMWSRVFSRKSVEVDLRKLLEFGKLNCDYGQYSLRSLVF